MDAEDELNKILAEADSQFNPKEEKSIIGLVIGIFLLGLTAGVLLTAYIDKKAEKSTYIDAPDDRPY